MRILVLGLRVLTAGRSNDFADGTASVDGNGVEEEVVNGAEGRGTAGDDLKGTVFDGRFWP